jgi:hypothetical protein
VTILVNFFSSTSHLVIIDDRAISRTVTRRAASRGHRGYIPFYAGGECLIPTRRIRRVVQQNPA